MSEPGISSGDLPEPDLARIETVQSDRPTLREAHVLAVLLVAYIVSSMDRAALSLLVEPVKIDLGLSDTQIGLLIGSAFAILYSTLGLFAGRLADCYNRRTLIAAGMTVWLVATAACGLARDQIGLAAARIGVGVGESALSPASYSLIASIFPKKRLSLASSIYALGLTLGVGVGTFLVGLLSAVAASRVSFPFLDSGTKGWRTAFLLLALSGLPALLLVLTLPEPRARGGRHSEVPTLREAFRYLAGAKPAFIGLIGGYAIMAVAGGGAIWWGPTWLIRTHGFQASTAGQLQGLILALAGSAGLLAGGSLSDRLFRRGRIDAAPRVIVLSLVLEGPLFALAYLTPGVLGIFAYGAAIFAFSMQGGLQGASLQLMSPPRMRGLVIAIFLMVANIVGMAVGPVVIPLVAERIFGGPGGIGRSLAVIAPSSALLAAAIIAASLGAYRRQVAAAAA